MKNSRLPSPPAIGDSSHARTSSPSRVRFISLQGRNSPLTRWVSESRDVAQDFATLFADELPEGAQTPRAELPPVTTVLIGADSDNTASHSTGWVAALRWKP